MEYTKRDLESVQTLRGHLPKWMSGFGSSLGICDCLVDLERFLGIKGSELRRLREILTSEFKQMNPDYKEGIGIFMWEKRAIEPRKQFLDDLIDRIKNSLSS